eukprot:gnl/TRDRNA2_/TRDRNA2_165041_c2_seq6.p1 gnl/TRDRNA2_/TRDRNA2_165041_c2~~gnl/TRDRNA2_/TRDRNA2_165041_c2_seq6.p1  ORF type:complete len:606 (+),score=77.59 gnl/TRDRNA2_/TRDRNA2_165041_c2_seq6:85-1902(+)
MKAWFPHLALPQQVAYDDEDSPPNLDPTDEHFVPPPEWSIQRVSLWQVLQSHRFNAILGSAIMFSLVLIKEETDAKASSTNVPVWVIMLNHALTTMYSIEIVMKFYVYRMQFFRAAWNNFDLVVIGCDLLLDIVSAFVGGMPDVGFLRVMRLIRLLRAAEILVNIPELYMLVQGLISVGITLLWSSLLLCVVLTLLSILAVEFLHPLNVVLSEKGVYDDCARCSYAFSTVMHSNLTLLQTLIAGDGWSNLAVPLMEHYPTTMVFFIGSLVCVPIGLLNLILTVIVDRASEARSNDLKSLALEKEKDFVAARDDLVKMCKHLDKDGSGTLCINELNAGFESNSKFSNALKAMDIHQEDLTAVFNIMDMDASGDVDYAEFVDQLYKMRHHDQHTMLVFIKHYIVQMKKTLREDIHQELREVKQSVGALEASHAKLLSRTISSLGSVRNPDVIRPANDTTSLHVEVHQEVSNAHRILDQLVQCQKDNSYEIAGLHDFFDEIRFSLSKLRKLCGDEDASVITDVPTCPASVGEAAHHAAAHHAAVISQSVFASKACSLLTTGSCMTAQRPASLKNCRMPESPQTHLCGTCGSAVSMQQCSYNGAGVLTQ